MEPFDLDNLTPVTKSVKVSQDFDLKYSGAGQRITIGDNFYANNNMNNNGFILYVQNNNILLSVQPNKESVFYTGKTNSEVKGKLFSYGFLADALVDTGVTPDTAQDVKLKAIQVGEKDGKTFFHLVPLNQAEPATKKVAPSNEESPATVQPQEEPEDSPAQEIAESNQEVDEFDEFADFETDGQVEEPAQKETSQDDFDEFDDPDFDNI